jgi:hypothetical protein
VGQIGLLIVARVLLAGDDVGRWELHFIIVSIIWLIYGRLHYITVIHIFVIVMADCFMERFNIPEFGWRHLAWGSYVAA